MTRAENTTVRNADMWILLLATMRYAITPPSYMPGLYVDLFDRYGCALSPRQRAQIAEEIESEIGSRGSVVEISQSEIWRGLAERIRTEEGK